MVRWENMEDSIQAIIDNKQEQLDLLKQRAKDKRLIELGLYDKEFTDVFSESHRHYDPDAKKYYRKIPLRDVSDEQLQKLETLDDEMRKLGRVVNVKPQSSFTIEAFKGVAYLTWLSGAVVGTLILFDVETYFGLGVYFGAFLLGLIFFAIAEIIGLLMRIESNTSPPNE